MPAISFNQEFLDALLRGDKQQTTRKQTDRIKVGDVCHIYIEQRNRITGKPLRRLTQSGLVSRLNWTNKERTYYPNHDYAHFLGKVQIIDVDDIQPNKMSSAERNEWAIADGFHGFHPRSSTHHDIGANMWFLDRYGDGWMTKTWTVIRWGGWIDRYFEPKP